MRNAFPPDSLKYQHLLGLIAEGESAEDIAAQLDCSEAYVTEVMGDIEDAASDAAALLEEAAQLARIRIARLSRAVEANYSRAYLPVIKSAADEDRNILMVPAISVTIGATGVEIAAVNIDLSEAASYDTPGADYADAEDRAGVDFYIHAINPEAPGTPGLLISDDATEPDGYTAGTDSRLIGGFHCTAQPQSSATKPQIPGWVGLGLGDILPGSVWDISPNDLPEL